MNLIFDGAIEKMLLVNSFKFFKFNFSVLNIYKHSSLPIMNALSVSVSSYLDGRHQDQFELRYLKRLRRPMIK